LENRIVRLSHFTISLLAALLILLLGRAPAGAAQEIKLDADRISFEESSGVATAEGNVRITNEDMRLIAPYVEYDSANQSVKAVSSSEGAVTFISAGNRVNGERLDYNLATRRGFLTRPNGKVEAFYVKGDSIEVMPISDITGKKPSGEYEDAAARWSGVVITTCSYPEPHYRLEAKELSVVPGRRVIIRKPRVFLGETQVFTYPFDYVVNIGARRGGRQAIFPKIGYESGKGVGLGVSGPLVWDSGEIDLEVLWWSDNIWEGNALLRQQVFPGLTVFGNLGRTYDKDQDSVMWRPRWGFWYEHSGWNLETAWSERELVTLEKSAGTDRNYVVWRKPELNIVSPWFDDVASAGRFRFFASWGKYEDVTMGESNPEVERIGAGIQLAGELGSPAQSVRPFYNAFYWYYNYNDAESESQQILDAVLGARWNLGDLEMESAYLRRWTWGQSPMSWDDYGPREDIYQQVALKIPTGSDDFWWKLAMRGAYSIKDEELAEMLYKVTYNQHCLQWDLIFRDDRRENDDWLGLKLTINAYPESGVRLMGSDPFDPAAAPNSLAPSFAE
jgi:LPS-assembly protein